MTDRPQFVMLSSDRVQDGSHDALRELATSDGSDVISAETYQAVRAEILALVKRAGLRGDPLEHSHRAVLKMVDLQWSLQANMQRLIEEAKATSDRLRNPSANLAPQIADYMKRDLGRFALANWVMPNVPTALKIASHLVIGLTLFGIAHELSHRDQPDVDALVDAVAADISGYTEFARQNSLSAMLADCVKHPANVTDPQGRRFCYALVTMNGVKVIPPSTPDWVNNAPSGSGR